MAESTARATAMHDIFAGREHHSSTTRTLGSAGDLTIYEINPLCESVGEDHGEISSFFETPVSQCIPKHGGRVRLNHVQNALDRLSVRDSLTPVNPARSAIFWTATPPNTDEALVQMTALPNGE